MSAFCRRILSDADKNFTRISKVLVRLSRGKSGTVTETTSDPLVLGVFLWHPNGTQAYFALESNQMYKCDGYGARKKLDA